MNKHTEFETKHLLNDLHVRSIHSLYATIISQLLRFIIQLIGIYIMARLLDPEDFGLIAMATIFTGFFEIFREFGLSSATIQSENINQDQVSYLFWVNIFIGVFLAFFIILFSPLLAKIYNEPRLIKICAFQALSFLIGGMSIQHGALLARQMKFKSIGYVDVISMLMGLLGGIGVAILGFRYWSLLIAPLITQIARILILWHTVKWRPTRPRVDSGMRPLLMFGAQLTTANFVGYFASNITPFIVGYVGGANFLGVFNRAAALTSISSSQILPPVLSVTQAALSRVSKDVDQFKRWALSLIEKISLISMFVTIISLVMADWIVRLLLGPGWEEAILVFRILSVFALVEPIASIVVTLLIASGKSNVLLKWKIATLIIIIISLSIGLYWGPIGLVMAYSISGILIRLPIFLIYSTYHLPITTGEYAKAIFPAFGISILLFIFLEVLKLYCSKMSPILGLFSLSVAGLIFYIGVGFFIKSIRFNFFDIFNIIKLLIIKQ